MLFSLLLLCRLVWRNATLSLARTLTLFHWCYTRLWIFGCLMISVKRDRERQILPLELNESVEPNVTQNWQFHLMKPICLLASTDGCFLPRVQFLLHSQIVAVSHAFAGV